MSSGQRVEQIVWRLVARRVALDAAALGVFAAGMTWAMFALVAGLFWNGWAMVLVAIPAAALGFKVARENRFWRVAALVEEEFPEVRGRLVAGIELARWRGRKEGYSTEMIEAAVREVEERLEPLPLGRLVVWRRLVWAFGALLVMGAGLAFFAGTAPARFRTGMANAFSRAGAGVSFEVLPGDTAVMPGGAVALRCRVSPARVFGAVQLERTGIGRTKSEAGNRRPEAGIGGTAERTRVRLENDTCRVVLPAGHGFSYRFRALGRGSGKYRVRVLEPLSLERLVFTLNPPAYSGLPVSHAAGAGFAALRGTVVNVEAEASRAVSGGRVVLGQETLEVRVDAKSPTRFTARFTVAGDASGAIELADTEDRVMQPATGLRVRALADEPPFVKLLLPGRDVDLPVSMKVLLVVNSLDDFGLGGLWLHFGKDSPDQAVRLKSLAGRREDTTFYSWDLTDAGLLPGEVLRYCVSVSDNDAVSGPKTSRTDVFQVRFPTMTEIYNAAVQQTERTASELGPMQSEQAQLSEELNRVAEELKKSRELSWDEKQALSRALSGQEGLMQQVADLKQEVENTLREMSQGMTLDQQTMERMGQLQQLMSELLPRELQQSLAQLRQKLEQQSPDVKRALEKFQLDQEKLKEGIDRALELLKKIVEEQRLEALARKAEELARAQEELTERLGKEPAEKSARMQQDIGEALDSLQKEMEELGDSMSDRDVGDSLNALTQQAEQNRLSEAAQQLASQMRQGRPGEARPGSSRLAQGMKKLAKSLSSLSDQLKKKRSADIARKLGQSARDLLMISEMQEQLEQAATGASSLSELAQREMSLHDAARVAAESLASLASQSMSVPPELGQDLAGSMNSMQQAAQAMVDNNRYGAGQAMAQARTGLNRTVAALLEAMANAQQGGGMSGGMEGLMQALSQMTGEQMGINSGMSGFPIPMPGGLTPAQAASLGRLLGKQRALREQLEQMLQSMGGTQPGLTGSLEGLVEEMKQVERDLSEQNVTRQLIRRQESILSHLLDAQRSIRQQGFKEERQSESGKTFELKQRPSLPEDKGERNRLLREELMRALKQGYPPEYEQMIRDYFDRLLQE